MHNRLFLIIIKKNRKESIYEIYNICHSLPTELSRHVSPEAAAGGPIALVEEGDIIELDVEARRLEITGVKGEHKTPEEMDAILAERKANWKGFTSKYTHGLLKLYSQHAVSAMKGAYME